MLLFEVLFYPHQCGQAPGFPISTREIDAAQGIDQLPVTQAAIDAYNTHVGTIAEFLGHQGAIAGAMDSAHC